MLALIATAALTSTADAPSQGNQGQTEPVVETPKPTLKPVPEVRVASKTYTRAELKQALTAVAEKYGQNYEQMSSIISCESGWDVLAYNKEDEKFVKGGSRGIAQFTIPTFEENCKGDYSNPLDQIECMGLLFKRGEQSRWSCK